MKTLQEKSEAHLKVQRPENSCPGSDVVCACMGGGRRCEDQAEVGRNDAGEVRTNNITKVSYTIPIHLVFYSIASEETLKNFK